MCSRCSRRRLVRFTILVRKERGTDNPPPARRASARAVKDIRIRNAIFVRATSPRRSARQSHSQEMPRRIKSGTKPSRLQRHQSPPPRRTTSSSPHRPTGRKPTLPRACGRDEIVRTRAADNLNRSPDAYAAWRRRNSRTLPGASDSVDVPRVLRVRRTVPPKAATRQARRVTIKKIPNSQHPNRGSTSQRGVGLVQQRRAAFEHCAVDGHGDYGANFGHDADERRLPTVVLPDAGPFA
jgi:hypothetical protein